MFTKLEQRSWIEIEVARGRSTQECFQVLREAQWHDGFKCSGKARMSFRTTSVQDDPRREQHSSSPCFPVGCWSPMEWAWVSSGSRSMSQNCVPHAARFSELPQTCIVFNIPWNFQDAAMAPVCSDTKPVGPLPKGRWRLSWTNRRYGRNLGSLIRTTLKTPIKWMEASRFSSSKKWALYDVLWRWSSLWLMALMG